MMDGIHIKYLINIGVFMRNGIYMIYLINMDFL